MAKRRIINLFMYEEWEFDTKEELIKSAEEEAIVCGDRIDKNENGSISIFNWHKGCSRWVGRVK